MDVPAINTDLASHAHPLPFRPTPREQQIRALVARVPINVDLRGLSFGRNITVSDVLTPKVRRAPFNENVNPNHLDVIECWKGLSHTQAMELAMWYQFLHECLKREVREVLSKDIVKDLLGSSEAIEEVYFVARMLDCLRSKPQRIIDISFIDVIDSMIGMFHGQLSNESAPLASSWSHFSGGLSLFLHKFLGLQDCFYQSAEGPCLEVSFDFQFAGWVLTATGDVMWQPPNIRFLHVPTTRASGEVYRITPFVWKEVDSPIRSPSCEGYVDQVDYTITRSPAIFTWDSAKGCFNTLIHPFHDGKAHTIETVISAKVTTPFPNETVRFEKQSRWSMKLNIAPTHQPPNPRWSSDGAWLKHLSNTPTVGSDEGTVVNNKPEITSIPTSPHKRKVSRPEVIVAATASKRRRQDPMVEVDDELGDVALGNDHFMSKFAYEEFQIAEHERSNPPVGPGGLQVYQHCITPPYEIQCDSEFLSSSMSPVTSESTTSDNAAIPNREGLHQEDILHNYHEFADRKLFKDAGLVISPVSDDERKAYESIFMGDSDQWSPGTEGSSLNMDTLMSDK